MTCLLLAQVAALEGRLKAELEARKGGAAAAGALADLQRLDAALAAAAKADALRAQAAEADQLRKQVWSLELRVARVA